MTIFELLSNPKYKNKYVLKKILLHRLWILDFSELIKNYDININDVDLKKIYYDYDQYIINKKPLEYIVWYVEFFGKKFFVNPDTLIPRPETEYMIQSIIDNFNNFDKNQKSILIDVWTGCGVLGISWYINTSKTFTNLILTDFSKKAIDVAKINCKNLIWNIENNNIEFLELDILNWFEISKIINFENIIFVANLPYIPDEVFDNEVEDNVKLREPRMAFVWWKDWLDLYRKMIDQILDIKKKLKNSQKIYFFAEMMTRQTKKIQEEYKNIKINFIKTFHFNIEILKFEI